MPGGFVGDPDVMDTWATSSLTPQIACGWGEDDERHQPLFGSTVRTPLFDVDVPIVAHPLAEPDKGTGVAMICTFGDLTDVIWWRELALPTRAVIGRDGRFSSEAPEWLTTDAAVEAYSRIARKAAGGAREQMVSMLTESGELLGDIRPIQHPVKFYEKGDRPLEIVTSRQWYIRNGGRDEALKAELLERGNQLIWHPDHMRHRYDNWVGGLNGDWLISRQRYFGVPFPLWYRLDADGNVDHDDPILADESSLPVDPQAECPPGFTEDQRGVPGGFVGDPDVMDTWATSSLTPQIACGWGEDEERFRTTFPMDLRPQGHDIIRTWLFSTVVRSHDEFDSVPWRHVALSGWILDPDRKKMSKSKGNVVTPIDLLEKYGSDGVRYWSASGRPGTDTTFDEAQMKVGRRLAIKLLNASRFALGFGVDDGTAAAPDTTPGVVTSPLDLAMLRELADLVDEATAAFEAFDYARALERTEHFFWRFCDDYLELVKSRAYGSDPSDPGSTLADADGVRSARTALAVALSTLHRLFAPFLPFTAEEAWSWWMEGSVHRAEWPDAGSIRAAAGEDGQGGDPAVWQIASSVLSELRGAKSAAKVRMGSPIQQAVVRDTAERLELFALAADDVAQAGKVEAVRTEVAAEPSVETTIVPAEG